MVTERIHEPRIPVELRPAWKRSDPAIERDAEIFWRQERLLLPATNVADRLADLCIAGYENGELIGLATARVRFIGFLGVKLAMARMSVRSDKRRSRLGTHLITSARELLETWSAANPDEAVMGMGTIQQRDAYAGREGPTRAFYRDARLGFIGWTANGEQMRVAWFDHGTIPQQQPAPPDGGSGKFE